MSKYSYCKIHNTYPANDEPCWSCINEYERKRLESDPEPTEYLHIGWYSPDEKRFCYCNEKILDEVWPNRRNHYTIKVYASNQIDRLTAENERLKEYIQHKPDCDFINWQGDNPKRKCTCGLEQTLKGGEL